MKLLLLAAGMAVSALVANAQVTQIKPNTSLETGFQINASKAVFISSLDSTLWSTDGTAAGTVQLSNSLKLKATGALVNGKLIFSASTPALGTELYSTDGTVAGTGLVKDINPGTASSSPGEEMALLNGIVYFTAVTPENGRELWRTDGTSTGTSLVKDIIPGTTSSNNEDDYHLFAADNYLLFSANSATQGKELYRSNGTDAGTTIVKDINSGAASSDASGFFTYNNMVLFTAKDATHGNELWRTNGTDAGTTLVKDINPNAGNSNVNGLFFVFNGKAFFTAETPTTGGEIWSTDGTETGTVMLKDIEPGAIGSYASIFGAMKVGNKFFFGAFTLANGFELWETDGTTANTRLFKDIIPGSGSGTPFIFATAFAFGTNVSQPLFQGSKFFFMAESNGAGNELWVCDGTVAGTTIVKDINAGSGDGITSPTYIYTSNALYFSADNNVNGNELWKTDGTSAGTSMVADIFTGAGDSDPLMATLLNGKLLFSANNGDHATATDLYVVNGTLSPLPLKLGDFVVAQKGSDALLQWSTLQELNTDSFVIERSEDGNGFNSIGKVQAAGNSTNKRDYTFVDAGIVNSGNHTFFYRLRIADKDGKFVNSKVISFTTRAGGALTVKLLQNPVQNELKLNLSGAQQTARFIIHDLQGKSVSTQTLNGNGQVNIPTAQLERGLYLLTVEDSRQSQTIKFIKH